MSDEQNPDIEEDEAVEHLLVCAHYQSLAVPGSVVSSCSRCEGRIWIAPSGQRQIADGDTAWTTLCIPCAMPYIEEGAEVRILEGARRELGDWLDGMHKAANARNN